MTEPPSPGELVAKELESLGITQEMLAANPWKLFLLGYLIGRASPTDEATLRFIVHSLYEGEEDGTTHRDDHGREHEGMARPPHGSDDAG